MKILYTCTYSKGPSGVWNRVYQLARRMIARGHEVHVISSAGVAGNYAQRESAEEVVDGIHIHRLITFRFGSENAYFYLPWNISGLIEKIRPDVVDCQTYRHYEGHVALKTCKRLGIRCILTTHSPFTRKRGFLLSLFVKFYDRFFGYKDLQNFDAIVSILPSERKYINSIIINKSERE